MFRSSTFWTALGTVVALIVGGLAFYGQMQANAKADKNNQLVAAANSVAQEGLKLAQNNEARLTRQTAEGVTIGEAPAAIAGKHPLPPNVSLWYVVYNATNKPINNVWVSEGSGGTIRIDGIEPCAMYALDAGFKPSDLYFSDADGNYWHRRMGLQPEQLTRETFPPMPNPDTGDSPWLAQVANCSTGG